MTTPKLPVTGVVLAGGQSRRMGKNKALLPMGGKPVVRRLVELFSQLFEEVMIAANDPALYGPYCRKVVADVFPGKGPLAGLHAALTQARKDWVFMTACDTPFVSENLVRAMSKLTGGVDAVLAETEEGIEPLNAFYSKQCLPAVHGCLEAGEFRMVSFHPRIKLRVVSAAELAQWDPDGRTFWNMNTPEDYEKALAMFAEMSEGSEERGAMQ